MSVTATSNSALIDQINAGSGAAKAGATQEMSDRFLKLLVTQLQHQDPMNPMQNAELTTQLAQMSTVEGINKMNTTLEGLTGQFRASQALQGSALVGRQVMAEGNGLALTSAGAAGGVFLDSAATAVKVQVFNGAGAQVGELALGKQPAGFSRFVWDGLGAGGVQQAQGNYTFKVTAVAGDKPVTATPHALGSVLSVSLQDSGVDLEISGLGQRGMDQVKQIF